LTPSLWVNKIPRISEKSPKPKVIRIIKTQEPTHEHTSLGVGTRECRIMEFETKSRLYSLKYDKDIGDSRVNISYNRGEFKKDELDAKKGIPDYKGVTDEVELHDTIRYGDRDYILVGSSYKEDNIEIAKVGNECSRV